MPQPMTVTEWDTAVNAAAGPLGDRLLREAALQHYGDVAAERARYDLMCDAFDHAVRELAAERLGRERDAVEYGRALLEQAREIKQLKAQARLAPLGRQIRQAIRSGQPIGIRPAAYSEADDEIGGRRRYLDGLGE